MNPCYHVTHLRPSATKARLNPPLPPLRLTCSSSEGQRKINELISDRGNVSDTAAFLSPSSCNDHHFLLSTQPPTLSQQDILNQSGGRTCLSPPVFPLIPVRKVKTSLFQNSGTKGGFVGKCGVYCTFVSSILCYFIVLYRILPKNNNLFKGAMQLKRIFNPDSINQQMRLKLQEHDDHSLQ